MKNELVAVLDLGSSKAVCLVARRTPTGGAEALALASVSVQGMRRGSVEDADAVAVGMSEAVRRVEAAIQSELPPLVVSIGGAGVEAMASQGMVEVIPRRPISRDDVLKVINHSRRVVLPNGFEQLQSVPRFFRIDGDKPVSRPIGLPASRLEVENYMVIASSLAIERLERALAAAHVTIDGFVLGALASGLGAATHDDLERGIAVVDIGDQTTSIAVFVQGALAYHADLPVGGWHVTSDVSQLLKTAREEAERIKLRYGAALGRSVSETEQMEVLQLNHNEPRPMQRRIFCEIVESRMREIARMAIERVVQSGYREQLRAGLAITGGASQMYATDELFEEESGKMRVRRVSPRVEGQIRTAVNRPEFASVVGLARFALEQEEEELGTVQGGNSWRERIRTLWTLFGK